MLLAVHAAAEKPVPPPDPKVIVGSWFGYDEDLIRFCRLELDRDGKGYCTILFRDSPLLYRINNWSIEGFNVRAELMPLDKEAARLVLRGSAKHHAMTVEFAETDSQWKREFRLFKEEEFLTKNRKAERHIENYKRSQPRKK